MQFKANRKTLLDALSVAFSFAPTRSPKEILQYVKIIVGNETAMLYAHAGECSAQIPVSGLSETETGTALLMNRKALEILRELEDDWVRFETDDSGFRVFGRRSKFRLPTRDASEFPAMDKVDWSAKSTMGVDDLRMALRRTTYATDLNSVRYAMGGVSFSQEGTVISVVGTDGRRMSVQRVKCDSDFDIRDKVVPTASAKLLERVLGNTSEETVDVTFGTSAATFRMGQTIINARLLEGRYPNWREMFTVKHDDSFSVAAGDLDSSIRQCSITSDKEDNSIDFGLSDGVLRLETELSEYGASEIEMPVDFEGSERNALLNWRFVQDICRSFDSETNLKVKVQDGKTLVRIESDDFTGFVMPKVRS